MQPEAYGLYKNKGELSPILPDFVTDNVLDIDFEYLRQLGLSHLLIDLDLTIRLVGAKEIEHEVKALFSKLKNAKLFKSIGIMTNNYRAKHFAESLGINAFTPFWEGVKPIRKPNTLFFHQVLKKLHAKPENTVMIGDKIHSDIVGANKAGLITVLVKPRGRDYWFDRLMLTRWREKRALKQARDSIKHLRKSK